MSDASAIIGFGLLFGGIVFSAFRALTDVKTRADVQAEVKAQEYISEAKVRALQAEAGAMERIAAAEAVALERIKAAAAVEIKAEIAAPYVSPHAASAGELDPRTVPDPDQSAIGANHIRMMDGFVYPKADFQSV